MDQILKGDKSADLPARAPPKYEYSIATVRPSIQPSSCSRCTKAATHWLLAKGVAAPEPDDRQLCRLLRPRRERPCCCRGAEQRNELAPFHCLMLPCFRTKE